MNQDKKAIREYIKAVIPIDLKLKQSASLSINNSFIKKGYITNCDVILSYMNLNDEVSIFNDKLSSYHPLFIPRIIKGTNEIEFHKYSNNLKIGEYNILEPIENSEKFSFDKKYNKITIFVPGRAFTTDGIRLGRGKGYYDRFLQKLIQSYTRERLNIIGVCFKEQLQETLPFEEHDIKMDDVVFDSNNNLLI